MDCWECKTGGSYMENRFRFRGDLLISVVLFQFHSFLWRVGCGVSTMACVGSQRTTRGDQFFPSTIWVLGMGLSLSSLETAPLLTDTHLSPLLLRHSFRWIRLGTSLLYCKEWHCSVTVCAHSSVDIAQTLMKVKGQLWEVSSFLLPRVSWVNPNHQAYTESSFTSWAISLAQSVTWPSGPPPSTAHVWDYRCVPPHSAYVLLGIKANILPTGSRSKSKDSWVFMPRVISLTIFIMSVFQGTLSILEEENHIKDVLSRIVVEMIKREWPQHWPDMLMELDTLSRQGVGSACVLAVCAHG